MVIDPELPPQSAGPEAMSAPAMGISEPRIESRNRRTVEVSCGGN
jgi:hypothetical protein